MERVNVQPGKIVAAIYSGPVAEEPLSQYFRMRFPNFRTKALTLSYDDGCVADKRLCSILDQHGLKSTFNIPGEWWGLIGRHVHMTQEDALEYYIKQGHELAAHGFHHRKLTELSSREIQREVILDRQSHEALTGQPVTGMAYPFSAFDDRVVEAVRACGISYARTGTYADGFSLPTDWLRLPVTCHHNDPRLMELARAFVESTDPFPSLFYLYGHSYEFDDDDNWHVIKNFCAYVGGRDDIWYVTNGEIFRYILAYRQLGFSRETMTLENPSDTDLWIDGPYGKHTVPAHTNISLRERKVR